MVTGGVVTGGVVTGGVVTGGVVTGGVVTGGVVTGGVVTGGVVTGGVVTGGVVTGGVVTGGVVTGGVVTGGVVTGGVVTGGVVTGGVVTGGVVTGGVVTGGVVVEVPPVVGGVVVGEEPVPVEPVDKKDAPGTIPEPQPVRTTLAASHNRHRDRPTLREDPIVRIMLLIKIVLSCKANKESSTSPANATSTQKERHALWYSMKSTEKEVQQKTALRLRRYRKISAGGIEVSVQKNEGAGDCDL